MSLDKKQSSYIRSKLIIQSVHMFGLGRFKIIYIINMQQTHMIVNELSSKAHTWIHSVNTDNLNNGRWEEQ